MNPATLTFSYCTTHLQPKRRIDTTWPVFCDWLRLPVIVDDAAERPAIAPYVLRAGHTSAREAYIEAYTLGLFDVDHGSPRAIHGILAALTGLGCAAFAYTSWSHYAKGVPRGEVRLRVGVPYASPIVPSRHTSARIRLASAIQVAAALDPRAERATQISYAPCQKSSDHAPLIWIQDGPFLDPFTLANSALVQPSDLQAIAKRLRNHKQINPAITGIAEAMRGLPYAVEGSRDDIAWRIAVTLAAELPHADPVQVAALFDPSSGNMGADPPDLREKFSRAWGQRFEPKEHALDRMAVHWARHGQPNRLEHYTGDELDDIGERFAVNGGLKWVLQSPLGYSFLTLDGYTRPVGREQALAAALTELAPAPVRLIRKDNQARSLPEISEEYGIEVGRVEWSLYDLEGRQFDAEQNVLRFAQRQRSAAPARSELWERILDNAYGREQAEWLQRWMGLAIDCRAPLIAAYLRGDPHTGKNLFASGMAWGWGDGGATTGAMVLAEGSWTANIFRCPLVHVDEHFPKDRIGRPLTHEFRTMIGSMEHVYRQKNLPESTIVGAVRFLLTSNGPMQFVGRNDTLDTSDIIAIAERIGEIRAIPGAAEYLRAVPQSDVDALAHGGIWRHALYRAIGGARREGRFGLRPLRDMAPRLVLGTGLRPLLLQWVVAWLLRPENVGAPTPGVRVGSGTVWLRSSDIARADVWAKYLPSVRKPESSVQVAQAIQALGTGRRDGAWCEIRPENILEWANQATEPLDRIKAAMLDDTRRGTIVQPTPIRPTK